VTAPTPPLGLLLDVDGPIASPVTRSIAIPAIAADLAELANLGIPIAFNTGRSDAFLREQVIPPLLAAGLDEGVRVWGICEKGAVWMRITAAGAQEVTVDEQLRVPPAFDSEIERIVGEDFADLVFYDETKRAMVSVEQRTEVESEDFLAAQPALNEAIAEALREHGLGYEWGDARVPAADGDVGYRIDPTIISTDVESNRVGKDLGASSRGAGARWATLAPTTRWPTGCTRTAMTSCTSMCAPQTACRPRRIPCGTTRRSYTTRPGPCTFGVGWRSPAGLRTTTPTSAERRASCRACGARVTLRLCP
jgi:hypothetical protein